MMVLQSVSGRGKGMLAPTSVGQWQRERDASPVPTPNDGRGCYYLQFSALDTAVAVEEPGLQVEWLKPRA
eukprot:4179649-Amphidinium_carterae.1